MLGAKYQVLGRWHPAWSAGSVPTRLEESDPGERFVASSGAGSSWVPIPTSPLEPKGRKEGRNGRLSRPIMINHGFVLGTRIALASETPAMMTSALLRCRRRPRNARTRRSRRSRRKSPNRQSRRAGASTRRRRSDGGGKDQMRFPYDFNPPPNRSRMKGTDAQREEWWQIRCWRKPRLIAVGVTTKAMAPSQAKSTAAS